MTRNVVRIGLQSDISTLDVAVVGVAYMSIIVPMARIGRWCCCYLSRHVVVLALSLDSTRFLFISATTKALHALFMCVQKSGYLSSCRFIVEYEYGFSVTIYCPCQSLFILINGTISVCQNTIYHQQVMVKSVSVENVRTSTWAMLCSNSIHQRQRCMTHSRHDCMHLEVKLRQAPSNEDWCGQAYLGTKHVLLVSCFMRSLLHRGHVESVWRANFDKKASRTQGQDELNCPSPSEQHVLYALGEPRWTCICMYSTPSATLSTTKHVICLCKYLICRVGRLALLRLQWRVSSIS